MYIILITFIIRIIITVNLCIIIYIILITFIIRIIPGIILDSNIFFFHLFILLISLSGNFSCHVSTLAFNILLVIITFYVTHGKISHLFSLFLLIFPCF